MHSSSVNGYTTEELKSIAPSVFAEHRAELHTSSQYSFVSTANVIEELGRSMVPLYPFAASESRTRIDSKRGYTKHIVRLRPSGISPFSVGAFPEVLITNSHDTATSFGVDLGLFRFACSNGLIVSAGIFSSYRMMHKGLSMGEVIDAVYRVVSDFPALDTTVRKMHSLILEPAYRVGFAERAIELRYPDGKAPISASDILESRRYADREPNLWDTFNVIQENLVRGGQRYVAQSETSRGYRRARTRAVNGIDSNMSLNQKLWALASEYANA